MNRSQRKAQAIVNDALAAARRRDRAGKPPGDLSSLITACLLVQWMGSDHYDHGWRRPVRRAKKTRRLAIKLSLRELKRLAHLG